MYGKTRRVDKINEFLSTHVFGPYRRALLDDTV